MAQKTDNKSVADREERLKAALKANLGRRKAQNRARTADEADDRKQNSGAKQD